MGLRYYRKLIPGSKVPLSNNSAITFPTLNGLVGYFATEDPFVQSEFERHMREQRSGISEISPEEFTKDYVDEKKNRNPNPRPMWREEFGKQSSSVSNPLSANGAAVQAVVGISGPCDNQPRCRGVAMIDSPAPASAVQVATDDRVAGNVLSVPEATKAPPPKQEFIPKVGKRSIRKASSHEQNGRQLKK